MSAAPNTPRLLVFDIDGTLLSSSHEILPSTSKAIQSARAAGHQVVVASSRPPRSTAEIADALAIGSEHTIALNGAFVTRGKDCLHQQPMSYAVLKAIFEQADKLNLHISTYAGWDWLVRKNDQWAQAEADIVGFKPQVIGASDNWPEAIHKMLVIGPAEAVSQLQQEIRAADLPVDATLSKPTYCEIVGQNVSKAVGIRQVSKTLALNGTEVVAFGDSENDLAMLEAADTAVAMGNATAQVKAAADLVTNSNDEDGIARALKQLRLI